jgi:hypothetical protein
MPTISSGGDGRARTASASTLAIATSPFRRATSGASRRKIFTSPVSSSIARCSTRSSPSIGSTCEM